VNGGLELGIESGLGDLVIYLLEFGERLDLVLWETCHIYATCQAYRAEAEFQHSPISKRTEYAGPNGLISLKP